MTELIGDDNPLEVLKKRVFGFLNSRLGWKLAALVIVVLTLWIEWDAVTRIPGVEWVLREVHDLHGLPQARADRFSIAIARLENDPNDVHRRLIRDGLTSRFVSNQIEEISGCSNSILMLGMPSSSQNLDAASKT